MQAAGPTPRREAVGAVGQAVGGQAVGGVRRTKNLKPKDRPRPSQRPTRSRRKRDGGVDNTPRSAGHSERFRAPVEGGRARAGAATGGTVRTTVRPGVVALDGGNPREIVLFEQHAAADGGGPVPRDAEHAGDAPIGKPLKPALVEGGPDPTVFPVRPHTGEMEQAVLGRERHVQVKRVEPKVVAGVAPGAHLKEREAHEGIVRADGHESSGRVGRVQGRLNPRATRIGRAPEPTGPEPVGRGDIGGGERTEAKRRSVGHKQRRTQQRRAGGVIGSQRTKAPPLP